MSAESYDLLVIGAGPGGYVAAIRAAQLGLRTACIDRAPAPGGTCLRIGCIPSKALLDSSGHFEHTRLHLAAHGIRVDGVHLDLAAMLQRKDRVVSTLSKGVAGLLKKNGIDWKRGHARLDGPGQVLLSSNPDKPPSETFHAKHILLATGSQPATLPGVDFTPDGRIGTSTDALQYSEVPKHLVVIGAGYIGLELGSVWRRLGAQVTVLEFLDRIFPGMDSELAGEAQSIFQKQGIRFRLGTRVRGAQVEDGTCRVTCQDADPLECDRVLVAVGRRPNTENLGLESVGLAVDKSGRIPVSEGFATSAPGVYAIGDVIAGPMLAHKAEEEGVAFAESLARGCGKVHYDLIPGVVYTDPELASVGRTEDALKADRVDYRKGVFPYRANGRAQGMNALAGRVKVLADAATDRILGVHILGAHAGDLINEAVAAMTFGATSEDLARSCHAHPTLGECLKEAALGVDGRMIHL